MEKYTTFEELRDKLAKSAEKPDPTYGICERCGIDFSDAEFDVDPEDLILDD